MQFTVSYWNLYAAYKGWPQIVAGYFAFVTNVRAAAKLETVEGTSKNKGTCTLTY